MYIQELTKKFIIENRQEIEISQQAMIAGVSSLIYSEYLRCIVQKTIPVDRVLVPTIRSVREILDTNGQFMTLMSERFIDAIYTNELFKQYSHAPELKIFDQNNIEVFKGIFDLYISKNLYRTLPEVISRKFCLLDENQQTFMENREADLFDRQPINEDQFKYIVEETVLHLLATIPSMNKDVEYPESKNLIGMTDKTVIGINHVNAICPIYLNTNIVANDSVISLLEFVTSTQVMKTRGTPYRLSTSPTNEVSVMTFNDIKK